MSWILENLVVLLTETIGGGLDYFGEYINNIYVEIIEATLQNVYYLNGQKFIVSTSLALIGVVVFAIVFSGYVTETDYDSEADPFNLLVKIAEVVALITNSSWIFNWLFKVSQDFAMDLADSANAVGYSAKTNSLLQIDIGAMGKGCIWHIFMLFIIFIFILIFTVVAAFRAGEVVALNLFFPIFALDRLTNSKEMWSNFFRSYMIALFSYAFQMFFYVLAMKSYVSATTGYSIYVVSTIVFLLIAIMVPQFLDKYTYKSGVKNAIASGGRMVVQAVIMRGAMR